MHHLADLPTPCEQVLHTLLHHHPVRQCSELVLLRPPRSRTSGFQKPQIVLRHPLIHPQPRSHESASSENVLVWLIGFHDSNRSSLTSSSHVSACAKQRGPWCEIPIRRNHLDCHCRCMIRSSSPVVLRYFLHGMCTAGQPATSQLNKFRKALELQRFDGLRAGSRNWVQRLDPASLPG